MTTLKIAIGLSIIAAVGLATAATLLHIFEDQAAEFFDRLRDEDWHQ